MSESKLMATSNRHLQKNNPMNYQTLDIQALVKEYYDLEVESFKVLTGELDGNYHLMVANHPSQYLLKICKVEGDAFDATGIQIFPFLQQQNANIAVQQIFPTKKGSLYHILTIEEHPYVFFLLSYIEGIVLAHCPNAFPSFYADLGVQMGLLDQAMEHFPAPTTAEPLLWDIQHLWGLTDFVPYLPPQFQTQVQAILEEYRAMQQQYTQSLPQQMIHNDFNPHNIIIHANQAQVAGILDFGDMVYSQRVNNLAIACSYFFTSNPENPVEYVLPLVQGYHQTNPLLPIEQEVFLTCVAARLAATMLITHRRVHVHPENRAYILRNVPPTIVGLSFFATLTSNLRDYYRTLFFAGNPL